MSSAAFILSGFASIPWLLTMKPKNFPAETPRHTWLDLASCYSSSGLGTTQIDGLRGAWP